MTRTRNGYAFDGEQTCNKHSCSRKAHFGVYYCRAHTPTSGTPLPKRPRRPLGAQTAVKYAAQLWSIERGRYYNHKMGVPGIVLCARLIPHRTPKSMPLTLDVIVDDTPCGRTNGITCKELAPKYLGPIITHIGKQLRGSVITNNGKHLAHNLVNFYHGLQCYPSEIDSQTQQLLPIFFTHRDELWTDPVGQDYKLTLRGAVQCCIWEDDTGVIHKLTPVEARQFYCTFYERLVKVHPEFIRLEQLRTDGTNIILRGLHGRPIHNSCIETAYLNPDEPFGHELILYHMLTTPNPTDYIWRKYTTFNF